MGANLVSRISPKLAIRLDPWMDRYLAIYLVQTKGRYLVYEKDNWRDLMKEKMKVINWVNHYEESKVLKMEVDLVEMMAQD